MKIRIMAAMLVGLPIVTPAAAAPFEYREVLSDFMRLSPDFNLDAAADDYMRCFRSQARSDEFGVGNTREATMRVMRAAIKRSKGDQTLSVLTSGQFGDYDLKARRFAFRPFNVGTHFTVQQRCPAGAAAMLPPRLDLYFSNPEFVDGIPMDPDAAKAFVDRRGQDRSVQITLTVRVADVRGENELVGQIVHAEVIDPKQQTASPLLTK